MDDLQRRSVLYLLALAGVVVGFSVLYYLGMVFLEGRAITFLHALQVTVETFSTTGYGADAPWRNPLVNVLVIAMNVVGVVSIFLALPVLAFPLFEARLLESVPTEARDRSGHIVIAGFSARGSSLVEELTTRDREYLIVEPDRDRAETLYDETDLDLIHADPETTTGLEKAAVESAHAVVADADDETNASIALAARSVADDTKVVTFVDDDAVEPYHELAGAVETFRPGRLIADALAKKVTAGVTPDIEDAVVLDGDFDIVELPVQSGSELAGVTVADSGIRERTGANVVGAWFRGEFVSPPPPTARIDEQTILVAAGPEATLQRLKELTLSKERWRRREGHVVVCGYGEVGQAIARQLRDADVDHVVVDLRDEPGVDVVGDIRDESTLREAGVTDARTVILATSNDTDEAFATLVCRDLDPDVEVIARANSKETVRKFYQAGADYVLAVATVAGRQLASSLLDEEVLSFEQSVELVRVGCGSFAGRTLGGADIRARTGTTVVAVERNGEVVTDLGADFRLREGDDLVVVGTDADVNRFAAMAAE
jgi:Trk K+ transport system NAD-binding subunit